MARTVEPCGEIHQFERNKDDANWVAVMTQSDLASLSANRSLMDGKSSCNNTEIMLHNGSVELP